MTLDQAHYGLSENDIFIYIVGRGRRPLLLATCYHRWPSPPSEVPPKIPFPFYVFYIYTARYSLHRDETRDDLVAGVGLDIVGKKHM